jgi:hypothetical protein
MSWSISPIWKAHASVPRCSTRSLRGCGCAFSACSPAARAGGETAKFGEKKPALLRRFRPFKDGTPSHDRRGALFAVRDAGPFQRCFIAWVSALSGPGADRIAIDGKRLRRSYREGGAQAPIPRLSAWSAQRNLVLGRVEAADESNEIVAIPRLPDVLTIKGATVTIDARGCRRAIAEKITAKGATRCRPSRATGEACARMSSRSSPSKRGAASPPPEGREGPWAPREPHRHGDGRDRRAEGKP